MENENISPEQFDELLTEFCRYFSYPEIKEDLWYCVMTALSKEGSLYDEASERTNLLFLYEKLQGLLEGIYRHRQPGTNHQL
jgi:hypothetical protein